MNNLIDAQITTDGIKTDVFINGKEVEGIRKITITQEAGKNMNISFDLTADKLTINGNMLLKLPDAYEPFYTRKEPINENEQVSIAESELRRFIPIGREANEKEKFQKLLENRGITREELILIFRNIKPNLECFDIFD